MRKHWLKIVVSGLLIAAGTLVGLNRPVATDAQTVGGGPGASGKATMTALFGGSPARNMVNTIEKNVPTDWNVEEGKQKNIKWVAQLGNYAYGGPVIADGKIFVGTTNSNPRDPNVKGVKSVLMAFNEADGKFLWQLAHQTPDDEFFNEGRTSGLCSTPVVEGQRLYYVTPACEVICADTNGKIQWNYDMMKQLKVVPHHLGNCSPLIAGDLVMVVTSNGVDEEGKVVSPKAPSFIAVHKTTGKLVWQSDLPGESIIEGQWSNPVLGTVNGKRQVIFPGGDGVFYSFEPETGKLIWNCNCNPTRKKGTREFDNYFVSTPVVVGDKLYVGMGHAPQTAHSTKSSHFLCLDITKTGDVSPKSYDAKDPANKASALVWAYGGLIEPRPEKGRHARFGSTISTAAVYDGLVYIAEERGYMYCLDAATGLRHWEHDFKTAVWGSPYWVDGKVYIGNDDGDIVIFEHGKQKKILATTSMEEVVQSTPVVANGVLYIATKSKLYAIVNR